MGAKAPARMAFSARLNRGLSLLDSCTPEQPCKCTSGLVSCGLCNRSRQVNKVPKEYQALLRGVGADLVLPPLILPFLS